MNPSRFVVPATVHWESLLDDLIVSCEIDVTLCNDSNGILLEISFIFIVEEMLTYVRVNLTNKSGEDDSELITSYSASESILNDERID